MSSQLKSIQVKIAATRALKEFRKAIKTQDWKRAGKLAPHATKKGPVGTEIAHLGTGSEQAASLTYNKKHGLHVRTVENPLHGYDRDRKADYLRVARKLRGNFSFAKFLGRTRLPSGVRMNRREYVPGEELRKRPLKEQREVLNRVKRTEVDGYDIFDHTNTRNTIVGPRGTKTIDFMASKKNRKYDPSSKGSKTVLDTDAALKKTVRAKGVDPFDDISVDKNKRDIDPRSWLGPGSRQAKKKRLPQSEIDRQNRVADERRKARESATRKAAGNL